MGFAHGRYQYEAIRIISFSVSVGKEPKSKDRNHHNCDNFSHHQALKNLLLLIEQEMKYIDKLMQ